MAELLICPASAASTASSSDTQSGRRVSSSAVRWCASASGHVAEVAGQEDPHRLGEGARRGDVVGEHVPLPGDEVDLLGELAGRGLPRGLVVDVEQAGRQLPHVAAAGMAVLPDEQGLVDAVDGAQREHGDRTRVGDEVARDDAALPEVDPIAAHVEDDPLEGGRRLEHGLAVPHLDEVGRRAGRGGEAHPGQSASPAAETDANASSWSRVRPSSPSSCRARWRSTSTSRPAR